MATKCELFPPDEAHARAYTFLKDKISRCEYRPRERIYAHRIAEEIHISRTPVREALGRLVHEGLVRKDGGWGYSVRQLTSQEIRDLFSVRQALEMEAARAAVSKITAAELARIEKLLVLTSGHLKKERIDDFVRVSREIHLAIVHASGNELLIGLLVGLHEQIQALGYLLNARNLSRSPQVLAENISIVNALKLRDLDGLQGAIQTHLQNGCSSTIDAMRDYMTP